MLIAKKLIASLASSLQLSQGRFFGLLRFFQRISRFRRFSDKMKGPRKTEPEVLLIHLTHAYR